MTLLLFPTCRHRREPRMRGVYHCRSQKLVGLKVVMPEVCALCPYVDHHHPGDETPFPDVYPEMAAERLIELLASPPLSWPPGWEDWEVTHTAHRLAADRFVDELSPYPEDRFQGRGLVIAGGGTAYFPSLYVTVRAIRHVGWTLPIQVWYLGRENEMPSEYRSILEKLGVQCVDADEVRERYPCRILNGWELKVYAVLHSPFVEVLSLDADCYPVRDPLALFGEADYQQTGAVFWPDLKDSPVLNWRPFGLAPSGRTSIESGQFLVNKRLCWRPLQLAWWYNDHSDWSYLHGYGDKHTLEVAWTRCGRRYTMFREDVEWSVHSFKHVGPDGLLQFVHRCKDKFRFGTPDYLNPQPFAANHFNPELPLETECFHWLRELAEEFRRVPEAPNVLQNGLTDTGKTTPSLRAYLATCSERQATWQATLQRWRATDWGEDPTVVADDGVGPLSEKRRMANIRRMLTLAAEQLADYCLFLEGDLLFNLNLRHNLAHWTPLRDDSLWMGSLCNLNRAAPDCRQGSLAIVLSQAAVAALLREWDEQPGVFDDKFAALARRQSLEMRRHAPSLVQRVPGGVAEGAPFHRAVDFDPFYRT